MAQHRRIPLHKLVRDLPHDLAVDLLMAVGYTRRHAQRSARAVTSMGDPE